MGTPNLQSEKRKPKTPFVCFNEEKLKLKKVLYASELQKVLGLVFFPQHFTSWPDWCIIKKPVLIKNVTVLLLNRLTNLPSGDKTFVNTFGKPISIYTPEAYNFSWYEELLWVPRSALSKHSLEMADRNESILLPAPRRVWVQPAAPELLGLTKTARMICSDDSTKTSTSTNKHSSPTTLPFSMPPPSAPDVFDRTNLLMSLQQMILERIPLPPDIEDQSKRIVRTDFVPSKSSYSPVSATSPMYAIDCEMVLTIAGSELARITMVDELSCVVFDRLVHPEHPVEDYLTRFSGITRDMLIQVDTKLADVQRELSELLPPDAILVGHSIGNDLQAMKVYHPYIIDTSVIYNLKGARNSKARLRFLAEHFLGRLIQTGTGGHSSAEDAIATMDLVRLKLSKDISFGDVTTSWRFPEDYNTYRFPKRAKLLSPNTAHSTEENDVKPEDSALSDSLDRRRLDVYGVHPRFQAKIKELLGSYNQGKPIHFVDRLLEDCKISKAYLPTCELGNSSPTTVESNNSPSEAKINLVSKATSEWLSKLAKNDRFIMANVGCSADWNKSKCERKVVHFCNRLYRGLPEHSLIILICSGDGPDSFAPALERFDKKEPKNNSHMARDAERSCYLCLTAWDKLNRDS